MKKTTLVAGLLALFALSGCAFLTVTVGARAVPHGEFLVLV